MTTPRNYILLLTEKNGNHILSIDEDGTIIHKGKTVEGPNPDTAAAARDALRVLAKPTLNDMMNNPTNPFLQGVGESVVTIPPPPVGVTTIPAPKEVKPAKKKLWGLG